VKHASQNINKNKNKNKNNPVHFNAYLRVSHEQALQVGHVRRGHSIATASQAWLHAADSADFDGNRQVALFRDREQHLWYMTMNKEQFVAKNVPKIFFEIREAIQR
jgi:hypothetical protein